MTNTSISVSDWSYLCMACGKSQTQDGDLLHLLTYEWLWWGCQTAKIHKLRDTNHIHLCNKTIPGHKAYCMCSLYETMKIFLPCKNSVECVVNTCVWWADSQSCIFDVLHVRTDDIACLIKSLLLIWIHMNSNSCFWLKDIHSSSGFYWIFNQTAVDPLFLWWPIYDSS